METETILVVEDERGLNRMISDYLEALGFAMASSFDGPDAVKKTKDLSPVLVLLDLSLPGLDGLEVARRIREFSHVALIMLTARTDEGDKLVGLEVGADDYITKPFSMKELAARIRAVLRRTHPAPEMAAPISHLDLSIDPERRKATRAGVLLTLTAVQFDILTLFLHHPGRVFSRLQILEDVQGISNEGYERTIDVHIKNLRKAIEPDPVHPRYLLTVWGVGYKLAEQFL
jgi:DNA-binding response OmpR family regulator